MLGTNPRPAVNRNPSQPALNHSLRLRLPYRPNIAVIRHYTAAILDHVYRTPLGSDIPAEIHSDWGQASTSGRLRKLANTITAPTLNAKRNHTGSYGVAGREWEEDLYYLYVHHYVVRYGFPWPQTRKRH